MTLFHFELIIGKGAQKTSLHFYYTSLEALIIANFEELTVSRSTLQKWNWKTEKGGSYSHENWVIRKGKATTTKEARDSEKLLDSFAEEGFLDVGE